MDGFSYENQGTYTYLVYQIDGEETVDSMSLGMLTNNKIAGLAPALFTQMDANKFIKYNVTSKVSAKQFFSGTVNKKRLVGVFMGIINAMLSAEDYMIDTNNIILDLDYIFTDVSTCDTVLICLPIISDDLKSQGLNAFFKNIMFTTQFDQTENCDHVAKIMNFLNSTSVLSIIDFKKLLESFEKSQNTEAKVKPLQQPVKQPTPVQQPVTNQQPKMPQKEVQISHTQPVPSPAAIQSPKSGTDNTDVGVQAGSKSHEKQISMFGLLMHYSKENAEIYKAQKAAKKSQPQPSTQNQPRTQVKQAPVQSGFVVPGSPSNVGFAVPGQSASAPISFQQPAVQQKAVPQQAQIKTPVTVAPVQQPVSAQTSAPQSKPMNFGETTVLGGKAIGETTVLGATSADVQIKPHLVRVKNSERISLDKPIFRIGKEKSYVDYFIGDNSAISRSHANIITREGEYFIVDTNSTNHTYLNGAMLQSNVEAKLAHGNKIRLANEDFEFLLY